MSQLTVELVLGRLATDERFRTQAAASLEKATLQEGYRLSQTELLLLSGVELQGFSELASRLNPGLCRAGR
ncbi:MAG: Os1348 family NHLP clan protein [Desulfuromonadaceae bacterium]|nr:Os1348 family NHLP clan protein [Desulfuromonadaceae bacterium]MDD2847336.1 Os1348 family NHLP clan protein [Desulfuromonadaceae bacterium]MDD4130280.1 Os1348 family NHLP clan protein [Desulfuromonadaceae bacterium]